MKSKDIDGLIESFGGAAEEEEGFRTNPELLLHPNVPKPLHGLAPRTIKGKKWWDETRRAVYKKAGYCCEACGVMAKWDVDRNVFAGDLKLHAHEDYDIDYKGKVARLNKIVALCPNCHNFIHSGRTQALYDKGIFDEEDCWVVFTHGESVLIDAGISPGLKAVDCKTYKNEWNDWVFEFEGNEYKSNFKSYEEWLCFYVKEE